MKNKANKGSQKPNTSVSPVQVAGIPRSCPCGTQVRRGIMWEHQATLYCSRLCATEAEKAAEALKLAETASEQ